MKAKPLTLTELSNLLPQIEATILHLRQLTVANKKNLTLKNSRADAAELRHDILDRLLLRQARLDGMSVGQIAKLTNSSLEAARYALKLLRRARKVKMVGKRATAKWFVCK